MPSVDVVIDHKPANTTRVRQVEAIFDVPMVERETLKWHGDVPIESRPWSVGLIVGPSGSGKSTVASKLFGESYHPVVSWSHRSVIDDVAPEMPVQAVAKAFSSVGFNTIPAWRRSHGMLSNGEKFRVDLARRLLELDSPIVVDEFSSVVDRQVAKIGSHAVQKYVRRTKKQFVAVTCHYDVEDWLQPDWVLEPATMDFRWRCLQRRPKLEIEICRVQYSTWDLFAPYHYLTAKLHKAARCFAVLVDDRPVAFTGIMHFPHPKTRNIRRSSRLVTLPDWQGLGLAFVLQDTLGAAYKALGYRMRRYPSHPTLARNIDKSPTWRLCHKPGIPVPSSRTTRMGYMIKARPCGVFEYAGPAMQDIDSAFRLIHGKD